MFKQTTNHLLKHRVLVTLFIGCMVVGAALVIVSIKAWTPLAVSAHTQKNHRVDAPLEIQLSQSVYRVDTVTITPEVKGEWKQQGTILGVNKLSFTPQEDFKPNQIYTVTLRDVQRLVVGARETKTTQFSTEKAPSLVSFSASKQEVLAANGSVSATFTGSVKKLRDITLKVGSAKLERTISSDGRSVSWQSKKLLPQGRQIHLVLSDAMTGEVFVERNIKIAPQPAVKTPIKATNFDKNDKATIVFSEAIDHANAPKDAVAFSIKGQGSWQDDKTYVFTPVAVSPGKTYKYTIKAGLQTQRGGVLLRDTVKTFSTPGYVSASITPQGFELNQASQEVRINFNQAVLHKSAEERLRISSGVKGNIRWHGNTMIVPVTNLGFQRTVSVRIISGVKPVFGISNTSTLAHSFTTEARVLKLDIPFYYQQYAQSCEAASVRMALAYHGISASDWQILQKFGYDPRPFDKKKNIWDDPQRQFVGDVKGDQGKGTGWGVYAEPVAAAVRNYGREATVRYGVSASFVAGQIYQKRPVVLWGIWGDSAAQKTWKTPDGKKVSGPVPMHVRLVVGVKGSVDNPIGFYIHDPITGPTYWTASYLSYNVGRAGAANQAVSIY